MASRRLQRLPFPCLHGKHRKGIGYYLLVGVSAWWVETDCQSRYVHINSIDSADDRKLFHGRQHFTKDTLPHLFTAIRENYGQLAFFNLTGVLVVEGELGTVSSTIPFLATSAAPSRAPTLALFKSSNTSSFGAPEPSARLSQLEVVVNDVAGDSTTSTPAHDTGEPLVELFLILPKSFPNLCKTYPASLSNDPKSTNTIPEACKTDS